MRINCIIVDDEPAARAGLSEDIKEIYYIEIKGIASNVFEAIEMIKDYKPELIFLDIEMPGLSGLDFLRLIKVKPMVIITTAFPKYALDGYELGVVDYLVKPISVDRLKMACHKAAEINYYRNNGSVPGPGHEYFFVKCNGVMEKIAISDILYIEAANNYVFIHTVNKKLMSYHTLKSMESHLPKDKFVKVHKSFIVSKDHIQQIGKSEVTVNQVRIPLGKNFKTDFHKDVIVKKSFRR